MFRFEKHIFGLFNTAKVLNSGSVCQVVDARAADWGLQLTEAFSAVQLGLSASAAAFRQMLT